MGKYSESIKNLKEIVKTFRLDKMNEDINNMEELLKYYQQSYIEPREIAIHILEEIELYGNEYYLAEDWITDCILGNLYPMPWQLNYEYFKCYVRRFVRGVTNPDELNAEDIDNIVHSVMKHDEFFDYMNDVISQHIMEYVEERNES